MHPFSYITLVNTIFVSFFTVIVNFYRSDYGKNTGKQPFFFKCIMYKKYKIIELNYYSSFFVSFFVFFSFLFSFINIFLLNFIIYVNKHFYSTLSNDLLCNFIEWTTSAWSHSSIQPSYESHLHDIALALSLYPNKTLLLIKIT